MYSTSLNMTLFEKITHLLLSNFTMLGPFKKNKNTVKLEYVLLKDKQIMFLALTRMSRLYSYNHVFDFILS